MKSPHLSKDRLYALMFETVCLTEEEDSHIREWNCPECNRAVFEVVNDQRGSPEAPASQDAPDSLRLWFQNSAKT